MRSTVVLVGLAPAKESCVFNAYRASEIDKVRLDSIVQCTLYNGHYVHCTMHVYTIQCTLGMERGREKLLKVIFKSLSHVHIS